MKNLFIVFAKLLGLVQIYFVLVILLQVIGSLLLFSGPADPPGVVWTGIGISVLFLIISLALVWVLLARTEWLANRVGLVDDALPAGFSERSALAIGITLIGVYLSARSLPQIAGAFIGLREFAGTMPSPLLWRQLLPGLAQLAAGLFLAFQSRPVADLLAPPPGE